MTANISSIDLWRREEDKRYNKIPLVRLNFKFPCTWTVLNLKDLKEILRLWILGEEEVYPIQEGFKGRWLLFNEILRVFQEVKYKMIDRDEIKSDYLEWESGVTTRVVIKQDAVKEMKVKNDGSGKYPVFNLKVQPKDGEVKKIGLFHGEYADMVRQADKKAGVKLDTLVGCVFDYTITVVEDKVKGTLWEKSIVLVSCPVEKVASSDAASSVQLVGL